MEQDVRWMQRFSNFSRAFMLLREVLDSTDDVLSLEAIVKEGIIQRFEYTFELAWNTLKDKMIADGLLIERVSPKYVFKAAYQGRYIEEVEIWIEMANDRNLMSHTYDFAKFDEVVVKLKERYLPLLNSLYRYFNSELDK